MVTKTSTKTKTTKKKAPKTAAKPKVPAALSSAKASAPKKAASVVKEVSAKVKGPQLKKKDLIEAVNAMVDVKKSDIKVVVEATLEELSKAISDGRELNLPPFGKVMPKRSKENNDARIVMAKIRIPKAN